MCDLCWIFSYGFCMPQLRNILITAVALYCCFMIFKMSANAGLFVLPLLFLLPPLVFKGQQKDADKDE